VSDLVPLEAEQALLGAWMTDREAWDLTSDLYAPGMFGGPAHNAIAEAAVRLLEAGKVADPVMVAAEVPPIDGESILVYLLDLSKAIGSSHAARMYAERVREAWALRRARGVLADALNAEGMAPGALIESVQRDLATVEVGDSGRIRTIAEDVSAFRDELEAEIVGKPGTEIRATGFDLVDQITGGLEDGLPHLMAARPGGGKSAYAVSICRFSAGRLGEPTGLIWLEDTRRKALLRIAAAEAGIPATLLRHGSALRGRPDLVEKLDIALDRVSRWPLYIESSKGMTPRQVSASMRRLKREKGVKRFLCDHLSRMAIGSEEGDKKTTMLLGDAFQRFAETCESLSAGGVMFHQLGREAEKGGPASGSWLFNSDVVYQHARVVGYLLPDKMTMRVTFPKVTYGPPFSTVLLGWEPVTLSIFNPVPPEAK
jgi:replicative DNA helicase